LYSEPAGPAAVGVPVGERLAEIERDARSGGLEGQARFRFVLSADTFSDAESGGHADALWVVVPA
jgi:hypothetical protein